MKNIILCSDGTGNSGGKGRGTNVWKIYNTVDRHGHETDRGKIEQVAIYDDGVGTADFKFFKAIGGAFGWGLSRNIRQLYAALVRVYDRDDRLFLFGFSRGAYTIRSLAGMISTCGILDRGELSASELNEQVWNAYAAYRSRDGRAKFKAKTWRARIHFIGVWDTVDAVGVPVDELKKILDLFSPRAPHEHDLNQNVDHGYHAISIDDERRTFDPVMWNEKKKKPGRKIEQVWFAGVHSNVGGGYPKPGMSNVTLEWMMASAKQHGLRFSQGALEEVREEADVHAKLYDSRSGLAAYYRYRPRKIEENCRKNCEAGKAKIHISVLERIERATDGYAPEILPAEFEIVDTDGSKQNKIKDLEKRLRDRREQRMRDLEPTKWMTKMRMGLYFIFLIVTFATLGLTFYLRKNTLELFPRFNELVTESSLYDGFRGLITSLVPSSLGNLIAALLRQSDILLIIFAVLLLLLLLRQRVRGAMKRIALDTWRAVFTPPLTKTGRKAFRRRQRQRVLPGSRRKFVSGSARSASPRAGR